MVSICRLRMKPVHLSEILFLSFWVFGAYYPKDQSLDILQCRRCEKIKLSKRVFKVGTANCCALLKLGNILPAH